MADLTLKDLAKKMRGIDLTMFATNTDGGAIASRPMSNNGEVDYDGDSYYFTWEDSRLVSDIENDANVSLSFQDGDDLWVAVSGDAEIVREQAEFEEHWTPDLDQWFEDGVETEGLVMVKVHATRIHYWDGEDQGAIEL